MACKHKGRVWENGWCNVACRYCTLTQESTCEHNHKTNADRIRAMTDRELAVFFAKRNVAESNLRLIDQGCTPTATQLKALHEQLYMTWMRWLESPAEDERWPFG